MAKPAVDISVLGAKALERALSKLPDKVQRSVVASANRKVAKKIHAETVRRVPVDTGKLKAALAAQNKPRKVTRPTIVMYFLDLPVRSLLDIDPSSPWYYPAHVEYGYTATGGRQVPPRSYLRAAVDEKIDVWHGMMRHDINKGIEKQMRRLAKK